MMYIHYCKICQHIHMLSGHKKECPGCNHPLTELHLSYLAYTSMTQADRDSLLKRLQMKN